MEVCLQYIADHLDLAVINIAAAVACADNGKTADCENKTRDCAPQHVSHMRKKICACNSGSQIRAVRKR